MALHTSVSEANYVESSTILTEARLFYIRSGNFRFSNHIPYQHWHYLLFLPSLCVISENNYFHRTGAGDHPQNNARDNGQQTTTGTNIVLEMSAHCFCDHLGVPSAEE